MKKRILFFLLSVFSFSAQADTQYQDVSFNLSYDFSTLDAAKVQGATLQAEVFVSENVSLNYNFGFSYTNDSVRRVHLPGGIIIGGPLTLYGLANSVACKSYQESEHYNDSVQQMQQYGYYDPSKAPSASCAECVIGPFATAAGIFLMMVPDGISAHIRPKEWMDIAPFVNLAGVDFIRNTDSGEKEAKYSTAIGTKLTFHLGEQVSIMGKYELRSNPTLGFSNVFGVGIGVGF